MENTYIGYGIKWLQYSKTVEALQENGVEIDPTETKHVVIQKYIDTIIKDIKNEYEHQNKNDKIVVEYDWDTLTVTNGLASLQADLDIKLIYRVYKVDTACKKRLTYDGMGYTIGGREEQEPEQEPVKEQEEVQEEVAVETDSPQRYATGGWEEPKPESVSEPVKEQEPLQEQEQEALQEQEKKQDEEPPQQTVEQPKVETIPKEPVQEQQPIIIDDKEVETDSTKLVQESKEPQQESTQPLENVNEENPDIDIFGSEVNSNNEEQKEEQVEKQEHEEEQEKQGQDDLDDLDEELNSEIQSFTTEDNKEEDNKEATEQGNEEEPQQNTSEEQQEEQQSVEEHQPVEPQVSEEKKNVIFSEGGQPKAVGTVGLQYTKGIPIIFNLEAFEQFRLKHPIEADKENLVVGIVRTAKSYQNYDQNAQLKKMVKLRPDYIVLDKDDTVASGRVMLNRALVDVEKHKNKATLLFMDKEAISNNKAELDMIIAKLQSSEIRISFAEYM